MRPTPAETTHGPKPWGNGKRRYKVRTLVSQTPAMGLVCGTIVQMPSSSEGLDRLWRAIRKQVMTPYDTDVYAWSQEQAALLDGKQWGALDIANIIEELLSVGASQ